MLAHFGKLADIHIRSRAYHDLHGVYTDHGNDSETGNALYVQKAVFAPQSRLKNPTECKYFASTS